MSCANCGASVSPGSKICAACGTPQKSQKPSGGFCGSCGTPLIAKYSPCPNCGHVKTTFNPQPNPGNPNPPQYPQQPGVEYKSESTGLILSIVLGLFCLNGIGQIYAGKVGRGIAIMVGSWVLIVVGVLTMGIGLIAYLAIFIWQIFDTKKLCREYNEFFSLNGRPPW